MVPEWARWQQSLSGVFAEIHWSPSAYTAQGNSGHAVWHYANSLASLRLEPGMVLHAHHPLAVVAARQWMARIDRRIPLVFTIHAIPSPNEQPVYYEALWAADFNVTVSRYVAEVLLQSSAVRIDAIIRNGMDAETRFLPRRLPPFAHGVRLVSVARLEKEKGLDQTARVVIELARLHVPVIWTLVGDGSLRQTILGQMSFEGLARRMRWVGFDRRPERWLEVSNLFILLPREEAFGNAFVEANMMGIPTVGPAIGGIPEHLIPGFNGLLADRIGPIGLARIIRDLYRQPRRWERMHQNAIRQGRSLTIERAVKDYHTVYGWPLSDLYPLASGSASPDDRRGRSRRSRKEGVALSLVQHIDSG